MMTCPECSAKEPFSTVKCECGFVFSPAMRKKEERRLAHRDVAAEQRSTADRYPALRLLARVYRAFAALAVIAGAIRVFMDLRVLFATDASTGDRAAVSGFAVALEVLVTGIAFITCYAIAEGIHLLFEMNDRAVTSSSSRP